MKLRILKKIANYFKRPTWIAGILEALYVKKIANYLKRPTWIAGILVALYVGIIYRLSYWWHPVIKHLGIENLSRWELIKGLGYFFGVLLLIVQMHISNRRANASNRRANASEKTANASEKTAKAALEANTEQRYHNSIDHLVTKEVVTRIGAIYNLYHISQSTNTYKKTIFDIFCAFLKSSENKKTLREKQTIIDKLFRGKKDSRVLKDPKSIDLTEADLTGVDLTGIDLTGAVLTRADLTRAVLTEANLIGADLTKANLIGADLIGANLTKAVLAEADLTEADLTGADLTDVKVPSTWDQWNKIKSLKGAKLDNIIFGSGITFENKNLKGASFKKANMRYINLIKVNLTGADLTGADLTGADLTGVMGLTFEQLSKVKCLYGVKDLNTQIESQLKTEKTKLFIQLEENSNEH